MNEQKAELVTLICKECQRLGLTLKDLDEVFNAVVEFYYENATP